MQQINVKDLDEYDKFVLNIDDPTTTNPLCESCSDQRCDTCPFREGAD